jgi:hypothetical protein
MIGTAPTTRANGGSIYFAYGPNALPNIFGDYRHERRHAGLEAVLPFLGETQALVPGERLGGVSDVHDRDDVLVHALHVPDVAGLGGASLLPLAAAPSCS